MKKLQIIGNVTRDAEVHTVSAERSAINFTVAVNTRFKGKDGQKVEQVTFVKCAWWVKNPSVSQYIKKGLKVYVSGDPQADGYLGEGNKVINSLKIIVRDIEFLSNPSANTPPTGTPSKSNSDSQSNKSKATSNNDNNSGDDNNSWMTPTPDDDLPF